MTITREEVADLQPGDVVELRDEEGWPGAVIRGPLYREDGDLCIGPLILAKADGRPRGASTRTLTVVSRPLYVNHPRTEPAVGDVVRDADSDEARVWLYTGASVGVKDRYTGWCFTNGHGSVTWTGRVDVGYPQLAARLRLLVDGRTGMTVPQ